MRRLGAIYQSLSPAYQPERFSAGLDLCPLRWSLVPLGVQTCLYGSKMQWRQAVRLPVMSITQVFQLT